MQRDELVLGEIGDEEGGDERPVKAPD